MERTICSVSDSSDLADGICQVPSLVASETVEFRGMRRSLGPVGPIAEIKGPISVHQSNQKDADLPSPIEHRRKYSTVDLMEIIFLTVEENRAAFSIIQ